MSRDDLILMGRQLNSIKVAQALSALTQIPLTHTLTLRLSAGGCVCAELDIPKEIMLSLSGQAAVTIIQYIRLATDCQILDISRISYHNQSDKNMYIHKVPQRDKSARRSTHEHFGSFVCGGLQHVIAMPNFVPN
jgi:hypothetical protein